MDSDEKGEEDDFLMAGQRRDIQRLRTVNRGYRLNSPHPALISLTDYSTYYTSTGNTLLKAVNCNALQIPS